MAFEPGLKIYKMQRSQNAASMVSMIKLEVICL